MFLCCGLRNDLTNAIKTGRREQKMSANHSLAWTPNWGSSILPITLCLEMSSVSSQVKKTAAETPLPANLKDPRGVLLKIFI